MVERNQLKATGGLRADQKWMVRSTFALIEPLADQAAAIFYNRLFQIAPEVRPLFKSDLDEQGRKLMQMIGMAVAHLDNLEVLTPAVQALGRRHADYGVEQAHYAKVGEALLWTLEQGLGDEFTDEVENSWSAVYSLLADTMKRASHATVE